MVQTPFKNTHGGEWGYFPFLISLVLITIFALLPSFDYDWHTIFDRLVGHYRVQLILLYFDIV